MNRWFDLSDRNSPARRVFRLVVLMVLCNLVMRMSRWLLDDPVSQLWWAIVVGSLGMMLFRIAIEPTLFRGYDHAADDS